MSEERDPAAHDGSPEGPKKVTFVLRLDEARIDIKYNDGEDLLESLRKKLAEMGIPLRSVYGVDPDGEPMQITTAAAALEATRGQVLFAHEKPCLSEPNHKKKKGSKHHQPSKSSSSSSSSSDSSSTASSKNHHRSHRRKPPHHGHHHHHYGPPPPFPSYPFHDGHHHRHHGLPPPPPPNPHFHGPFGYYGHPMMHPPSFGHSHCSCHGCGHDSGYHKGFHDY